jgi:uncharacterized membrane protein
MQCPACHNEVSPENAFCNHCGAPMAAATSQAAPAGAGATTPPPTYAVQPVASGSGLSENAAGAIAYLTIIPAIIFLIIEPYNRIPFVRFHSWQSIGLCVAAFVLQVIVSIIETMAHFIPGTVFLFMLVHFAIGLGIFLVWLFVILKASKGEWYKLPFIGDFAENQARS